MLLAWMMWRVFFAAERTFDTIALAVAVAGVVAAWLRRRSLRTCVDAPMLIFAGLTALSAIVHRGLQADPIATTDHTSVWRPVIMVSYFYGATALLGRERRLGALMVAIVGAILLISAGASYDNLLFTEHGHPITAYRTVPQWNGYAELGLLLVAVLPLVVAVLALCRQTAVVASAAFLSVVLLVFAWEVDSRAAYVAMAATFVVLVMMEVAWFRRVRLLALASMIAIVLATAFVTHRDLGNAVLQGLQDRLLTQYARVVRPHGEGYETMFGRYAVWRQAAPMIRDHVWLGVGPGRYTYVLQAGGYVPKPTVDDSHAHSMPLHVAAECGIPAALAFLAIWWRLLGGLRRRCDDSGVDLLAFGFGGALIAYLIRNLGDHFTSGIFVTSDRIEFLLWTLFAAAAAVICLPRHVPMAPAR
jgi:O-antigen ligase